MTDFRVGFTAPQRAYTVPETRDRIGSYAHYVFAASGPVADGCVSTMHTVARRARRGERVRVTLRRGAGDAPLCEGRWHGKVTYVADVLCTPERHRCPLAPGFVRTEGRFAFQVAGS